ncbi:thiol-disulfide oxidoreductase DCC family protein [Leptospira sp. GIMC2001]|uniref:thiol-disulfide oxidoreductase DCC family protein n=1 Tax=Leptospira sp. GIMC2001 TaxID=1513297 RepID=UPI0023496224|nr:DCC1-like thiol-disulfide oxidoreductase family protein [Leptospira sp. GIMC2001]WCL50154.1 DCC1-like thiol-disulfide oxidoreductase family protein [Leptospira sp. GIMC2001]
MEDYERKRIVIFDSDCNLCNFFVNFCIERDPDFNLHFAPIRSPLIQDILLNIEPRKNLTGIDIEKLRALNPSTDPTTILFYEDGFLYSKSHAVFRIANHLNGIIRILKFFRWIPDFITNTIYYLVAKYRYRLFGRSSTCRIPQPEDGIRFID